MDIDGSDQNRYHRQMLLPQLGQQGQRRLASGRVLLVGCGALGTIMAEQLARAGVGFLRIADRDVVELSNLQRQVLFDEQDAREGLPKAVAAANRLRRINSSVTIDAQVVDVHAGNIEQLVGGDSQSPVDLILDGTDNVETRYLINDVAVKRGIPWVYGAAVGSEGRVMSVLPGKTACLRCVFADPPGPGQLATCDSAGVLGPAVGVVASLQACIAIKILSGNDDAVGEQMTVIDLWNNRLHTVSLAGARCDDCLTCGARRFEFLDQKRGSAAASLCGRNAVQIRPMSRDGVDLPRLAARLETAGTVQPTPYFVRCTLAEFAGISLTVFPDGRVIVHGTGDVARARSISARFVGA
jgi:adenylyltransferase/sulfurtransferase